MAVWDDAEAWSALKDGSACPLCELGGPRDVVAEFSASWVTAGPEAPLPGYACVVAKQHVVEPFELGNYEIHGNTIPHLHMHLLPRSPGDGLGERTFVRTPVELDEIRVALQSAYGKER